MVYETSSTTKIVCFEYLQEYAQHLSLKQLSAEAVWFSVAVVDFESSGSCSSCTAPQRLVWHSSLIVAAILGIVHIHGLNAKGITLCCLPDRSDIILPSAKKNQKQLESLDELTLHESVSKMMRSLSIVSMQRSTSTVLYPHIQMFCRVIQLHADDFSSPESQL